MTDAARHQSKYCKDSDFLAPDLTAVTGAGLADFKDCTGLTWPRPGGLPNVTDAGPGAFKGRKDLRRLRRGHTPITDAGLAHLAGMDHLTEPGLANTKVTAEGVGGPAEGLPKCKITWDGGVTEPRP
jgi:hypothetical protein